MTRFWLVHALWALQCLVAVGLIGLAAWDYDDCSIWYPVGLLNSMAQCVLCTRWLNRWVDEHGTETD